MIKSVLGKIWQSNNPNEEQIANIARELQISDLLAQLIASRTKTLEEAINFFDPKLKNLLPDPFHLLDMEKGVDRIIEAINKKEKICIFADYDVDGATSSALLKNIFYEIGVEVDIYVPDRIEEGYGPTTKAMETLKHNGVDLIITVDCGSVAFDALLHASEIGLDVIVIDHHISLEIMPKAVAVINPNRIDETSPCKNLAAAGVSFLVTIALCSELKKRDFFTKKNITPPDLMKQLDIVALGTVCDVMILTGLNRAFVKQGLKIARRRNNIGYATLCDVASLDEAINCYHLGFVLGPRINAGGRVGTSSLGATLLSTKNKEQALKLAKELDLHNNNRKIIEITMLEEAYNIAKSQIKQSVIFVKGEKWHPGVIGIVASRLKEKYNKPVAVIAVNEGIGKGSCRSVKGCDFGSALIEAKLNNILIAGGGHAMAAGFTIDEAKIDMLHKHLEGIFAKSLNKSTSHLEEFYDLELTSKALNIELFEEISKLEPFGNGNPTPIFKISNLFVLKANIVGQNHLKIIFAPQKTSSHSTKTIEAIAFNAVNTVMSEVVLAKKPHNLSVFGTIKLNNWNNRQSLQIQLKDLAIE